MSELDTGAPDASTPPIESQTDTGPADDAAIQDQADARAQAILELDKVDRFKFGGQEWTAKDLQASIMRQKDYTQKTQGLATERKAFQEEQKFYENLTADLLKVKADPRLVNSFINTYPEKFHAYLDRVLNENRQTQGQPQSQGQQVDVQLLSRLDRLEKSYSEQEVAKQEQNIAATVEKFSKAYPDAANFKELVLGRAYEANMGGAKLNDEAWENIFKSVDQEVKTLLKSKYGELVKKQTDANAKAKDVQSGGGTVGRAPKKFTSFREINTHAFPGMTGEGKS